MTTVQRSLFAIVPGGYVRLGWAVLLVLAVGTLPGLLAAGGWTRFDLQAWRDGHWLARLFATAGADGWRESLVWLRQGIVVTLLPALAVALPVGLVVGLSMPVAGLRAALAMAVVAMPLALPAAEAAWLMGWVLRVLLPRPAPDTAATVALAWQGTMLVALFVHAVVRTIPAALWQAADRDDLSRFERWRWMLWPLLWPAMLAAIVWLALPVLQRVSLDAERGGTLPPLATHAGTGLLLVVVVAIVWQTAWSARGLRAWPNPPADPGPQPVGHPGRPRRRWRLVASLLLLVGVPLLVLISVSNGSLEAADGRAQTIDLLELLIPWGGDGGPWRDRLPEPAGLRAAGLVAAVSLLLAGGCVLLAWPAAWALARLAADGVAIAVARTLLVIGILSLAKTMTTAAAAAAAAAPVLTALPAFAAVLFPGLLATAIWLLERLARRENGYPVTRGVDPMLREADETAALAGDRPARLRVAWQRPGMRTGLIMTLLLVWGLAWRLLAAATGGSPPPAGSRAIHILIATVPVVLLFTLAFALMERLPPARRRPSI